MFDLETKWDSWSDDVWATTYAQCWVVPRKIKPVRYTLILQKQGLQTILSIFLICFTVHPNQISLTYAASEMVTVLNSNLEEI